MKSVDRLAAAQRLVARVKTEVERSKVLAMCREFGHEWGFLGGANCGCHNDSSCSIAVYGCSRCGDSDYGDNAENDEQRINCAHRKEFETYNELRKISLGE